MQTTQIFSEGESPTISVFVTIPYEFISSLVLLLLQHGNFSYKCRISWCNAYWRGALLLGETLTSMRVRKGVAMVLRFLEKMW